LQRASERTSTIDIERRWIAGAHDDAHCSGPTPCRVATIGRALYVLNAASMRMRRKRRLISLKAHESDEDILQDWVVG
jgi:hypothetical protein